MRSTRARAVALLSAVLLCACATPQAPTIVSTMVRRSPEPPRKVFVLAQLGQTLPDEFENGYVAAFARDLEKLGATVKVMQLTGLELDRAAPDKAREAFAPDVVFTVIFIEKVVTGSTHRGVVILRLADAHGAELWRSQQPFAFTYLAVARKGLVDDGARAGSAAVAQLTADRIFPGTI